MSVRTFSSLWRKCLSMDVLNYWNNLHVSTYFLIIMEKVFENGRLKLLEQFACQYVLSYHYGESV